MTYNVGAISIMAYLGILLGAGPLFGLSPTDTIKTRELDIPKLRTIVQNRLTPNPAHSIAIAVVANGTILWEEGFGWADRENRVPATAHTAYYLASVTKSITATALMILQERKMIQLDQPINNYLGKAHISSPLWDINQATVRRVATHTAGIPTFDYRCFDEDAPCSASLEETINRYGLVCWPPADRFDYSNLDYGILGYAITQVSGKSLAAFLNQEIFKPLGMSHSSLGKEPSSEAFTAQRYSYQYGLRAKVGSLALGASAVYSSVHDLALFSLLHLNRHPPGRKIILTNGSIDLMHSPAVTTGFTGQTSHYGLGWWVGENKLGYQCAVAQGGTDDASTQIHLIPSKNIGVVILANMGMDVGSLVNEVLSMLLPKSPENTTALTGQATQSPTPKTVLPEPMTGNWKGFIQTHEGNLPLLFSVDQSGKVQAQLGAQTLTASKGATYSIARQQVSTRLTGDLGLPEDTGSEPYDLDLYLYPYVNGLYGLVTTNPRSYKRRFTRLSYWVELTKQ